MHKLFEALNYASFLSDRFRTTVNILGDAIGAGIIDDLSKKELAGKVEVLKGDIESSHLVPHPPSGSDGNLSTNTNSNPDFEALGIGTSGTGAKDRGSTDSGNFAESLHTFANSWKLLFSK